MKSIKEKAEEYAKTKHTNKNLIKIVSWDFEAGTNYVLGEIENVIKSDRILGHPFPSLEMRYNQIISVIEQLKK